MVGACEADESIPVLSNLDCTRSRAVASIHSHVWRQVHLLGGPEYVHLLHDRQ